MEMCAHRETRFGRLAIMYCCFGLIVFVFSISAASASNAGLWTSASAPTRVPGSEDWGAAADSTCRYFHPVPTNGGWTYFEYRATSAIPNPPTEGATIMLECHLYGDAHHIGQPWATTAGFLVYRISPETYTLALTPETATIEPGKSFQFKATVTKQDGGAPSKPVPVSVKVEVDPISGGHDHGETFATRPKGSVAPASGNTVLPFTFAATEVSGTHTITATCDLCVNKTEKATVNVMVPGLTTLTPSTNYVLVGGEAGKKHADNHWLTATAIKNLKVLVKKYNIAYPDGPLLRLNDASLIWGGKFDIAGNWAGEHKEHRRGDVIDIRANQDITAIPEPNFKEIQIFASQSGGAFADLHCNPPYSRTCPVCILDTGSNRHFHVYLLGK